MPERRAEGIELARAVGAGDSLIVPLTTSASIYAAGAAHPMPAGTMLWIDPAADQPAIAFER